MMVHLGDIYGFIHKKQCVAKQCVLNCCHATGPKPTNNRQFFIWSLQIERMPWNNTVSIKLRNDGISPQDLSFIPHNCLTPPLETTLSVGSCENPSRNWFKCC